jgi:hypothetical protein
MKLPQLWCKTCRLAHLKEFEPTTVGELMTIIRNAPIKTSSLDPIPP